jgi:hypothetical protein
VGVVAATTAYVWVVPRGDGGERFLLGRTAEGEPVYAALGADAGRAAPGEPVAREDTPLTPDVVERLQSAGVERVRVKTFRLSRWTHLPHFAVACVGLVAGAILTRLSTARAVRLAEQAQAGGDAVSPEAAVKELRAVARALLDDVTQLGDEEHACRAITQRLGDALRDFVPLVVEARDRLVARLGLGGYASFMDAFAAGERSVNRAWSAAADGALGEAVESLERAGERLEIAEAKLTGRTSGLLPLG